MALIESIAAIRVLVTELIGRVTDNKTAQIVQQIQGHQHELEAEFRKEQADVEAKHQREKSEMADAHAGAIAKLVAENTALKAKVAELQADLDKANKQIEAMRRPPEPFVKPGPFS